MRTARPLSRFSLLAAAVTGLGLGTALLLALAATPGCNSAVTSASAGSDPLVLVASTGPGVGSPFGASAADNPATQPGTVALHSELEPSIAVNPTNPLNVVVAYQQDRWDTGGSRGIVAAVSNNGGTSFTPVALPRLTQATDGVYQRASDVRLAFAINGDLFAAALGFTGNPSTGVFTRSAVTVSKSGSGGSIWIAPVVVSEQLNPSVFFEDKASIAVDPFNAGQLFAVWDRLLLMNPQLNGGPILFSRSGSGGFGYESPRVIADFGDNLQTTGNEIVVMNDGTLADVFALTVSQSGNPAMAQASGNVIVSGDRGQTWGERINIATFYARSTLTSNGVGVRDPQDGAAVRAPGFYPAVAVNPTNNELYMVWQDTRFSNPVPQVTPDQVNPDFLIDEIAFSRSGDGGVTWSAPIKINKTPTSTSFLNRQAFLPSIAVTNNGIVAVTYYDFRNNTSPSSLGTDYFAVFWRPGGGAITESAAWGAELRLTNSTFDLRKAVRSVERGKNAGYYIGDRMGLVADRTDFLAAFVQTTGTDPGSVYVRRFRPPPRVLGE